MWVLKQLWFWIDLAAIVLIFIAAIGSTVHYKSKIPLWCWILFDIAIGLLLIGFLVMLAQVSMDRKRLEKKMDNVILVVKND